ncbi:hypothetical protein [Halovivax sp.]|uniref:hypothetical protein n=1 Tax=Halovivax sp. TaxID=1935978 RepID=UPI0025C71995|nr:hypothetical protein [Halovivax sp.]
MSTSRFPIPRSSTATTAASRPFSPPGGVRTTAGWIVLGTVLALLSAVPLLVVMDA